MSSHTPHKRRCSVCGKIPDNGTSRCSTCRAQTQGVRGNYESFLMMPIPENGATHAEIAIAMGCSRERVRQIEQIALRKLRHNAQAMRLLKDEDD